MSENKQIKWQRAVAIDFDGCLCENKFPEVGKPNWQVIERAKSEKAAGSLLILWTSRDGEALEKAVAACESWGLEFDAINVDVQQTINAYGGSTKVFATEYWDDRARPVQDGVLRISPYKMATIAKAMAEKTGPFASYMHLNQVMQQLCERLHPSVIWHQTQKQAVIKLIAKIECALEQIKYAHKIHQQVEAEKDKLLDNMAQEHNIEPFCK